MAVLPQLFYVAPTPLCMRSRRPPFAKRGTGHPLCWGACGIKSLGHRARGVSFPPCAGASIIFGAMATLLLSMPKDKNFATGLHQPISTIFASGKGPDYVLSFNDISRITKGMKVIVFDRPSQQAEGVVAGVCPSGNTTRNGRPRYHVLIRDLKQTTYATPPNVNRCGVGFA